MSRLYACGSTCDAFPVGVFFYYNCFGEPVLSGTPVRMNREQHESKSLFKRLSSVTQRPFDGVPRRHVLVGTSDYEDAK